MSRIDWIALCCSLLAFLATAFVSVQVFEHMPHIEDEMTFVWQARAIERGQISVPSPQSNPNSLLTPFVIDYNGQRFGKYPLGWPVVLAAGEALGARALVNPFLTGLAVWFFYRLACKMISKPAALLAAFLMITSPFVLMNGGSLLSHPWSLLLTILFCIAWLDAFVQPNPALPPRLSERLPVWLAGLSFGALIQTRPWTAVGVGLPFAINGLMLLIRGSRATRLRLVGFGLLVLAVSLLYPLWQYALTGSPLTNPYLLWWPYDKVGFGPGHGASQAGYQPIQAYVHTLFSLFVGNTDLFGWPLISWVFMPFGLIALRRSQPAWLVVALMPSLIAAYALYWTPSWVFGPRYYYEALPAPLLLTSAGIAWLAGRLFPSLAKHSPGDAIQRPLSASPARLRFGMVALVVMLLVSANLIFYIPLRVLGMANLYNISSRCLAPFQTREARQSVPALVFVHLQTSYLEYGCLLDLNNPFLDSDFLVVISRGPIVNQSLMQAYPNRTVLHYYPDTFRLLETPRDSPRQ